MLPTIRFRTEEPTFDLDFDAALIRQSIATQYGIKPSEQGALHYWEYSELIGGLMHETPLGHVIEIRTQKDRKTLCRYGRYERFIRAQWARFLRKKPGAKEQVGTVADLQKLLKSAFG